jgi:ATP-dependent RNA helicase DBP3
VRILSAASSSSDPSSIPVGITTLVVSPTRELAIQTHDNLTSLGAPFGVGSVAVFGGVSKDGQIKLLNEIASGKKSKKGNQNQVVTKIIVGTPGRILDLVSTNDCDLSAVDYLVLDEADRMLDKGFENDIRKIIGYTKQGKGQRQTLMCKFFFVHLLS